ncbi:MAG: orotidine-5'-phosphate decarboxylase, partial [Oscillospiraceae bacterium]|nr:orotidine-5'-phosphate decarboxylase [Oscillospiraceae bacterium]
MNKDVIIACDFPSREETLAFLKLFGDKKPFVKIGMELFYSAGPDIVREIKDRGHGLFLDLKLHDIPNTVKRAMAVIARLGADITNVHAAGGSAMMEAALEGLSSAPSPRPLLIAVTQLTSTDEARMRSELLIDRPMEEAVMSYAELARSSGLDGVVCSPFEARAMHERCGADFLAVTPGIRFEDGEKGDQARAASPAAAGRLGSDLIVVGRPITRAADPAAAYQKCLEDFIGGS